MGSRVAVKCPEAGLGEIEGDGWLGNRELRMEEREEEALLVTMRATSSTHQILFAFCLILILISQFP